MTYSQWGYPTSEKLFIQTITTTVACRLFAACLEVFAMYLTPAHAFQGAEGDHINPVGAADYVVTSYTHWPGARKPSIPPESLIRHT